MELLAGFVLLGLISWAVYLPVHFAVQFYIRKMCRYRGVKEKPGRACVICAYNEKCSRAKSSKEYKQFAYYRKVLPDRAKALFDEIWAEEKAGSGT
ncbi:MAG: hypothetical protein OSJ58_14290 [Dysosmobacter sp.]|nr:hypothetical protein [Dysosmobacter sp.]